MNAIKLLFRILFNPLMYFASIIIGFFLEFVLGVICGDLHFIIAGILFFIIGALNLIFCPGIADDPLDPYFKPLPRNSQEPEKNTF